MTKNDLYNEALLLIGSKPIDGTNGLNSEKGQACEVLFASVVEEVQSLIPWAELVKTTVLSPTGIEDIRGVQYNKPKDCLRVLNVNNGRRNDGFEEEGGFLFYKAGTLTANLPCRYVRRSLIPDEWSTELRAAIRKLLAARILPAITKNMNAANSLEEQFWNVDRPRLMARHLNRTRGRRKLFDDDNFS